MNAYIALTCILIVNSQNIDVSMPDGSKTFPNDIMLMPDSDVFSVEDGFIPLSSPEKTSKPSGASPLKFGQAFHWLCDHQSKDTVYRLICKGGRLEPITIIGWVPYTALLLRKTPITTDDVNGLGVIRKALIVNSKEWIKDNLNNGNFTPPTRYLGLLPNAPKAPNIKFFNILFVYEIDEKTGRVLLGYSPRADYFNGSQLAGWLPEKALCYWDTRDAVQWNFENKSTKNDSISRKTKVYAFNSKESVKQFIGSLPNGINIPGKSPPLNTIIAEENIDPQGNSIEWDFDETRYPKISKPADEEHLKANWGDLIEIGVIGSFRGQNGNIYNPKIMRKMREKMVKIEPQIKQHYILFVIDNTGSMEEAFKKMIPDYIKAFTEEKGLTEQEKQQIKIAVTFYNDFSSELDKNKPQATLDSTIKYYKDWVAIGDVEGKQLVVDLKKMEAQDGGDAREQVIHGIKTALEKSMASKNAPPQFAFKRCVVVGDMGNHVDNNLGQDINVEMNKIADLLVPMNATPWDFLPIQVPNPRADKGQRDPDYNAFTDQMKEIDKLRSKLAVKLKKVDIFSKPDNQPVVFQQFNNLSEYLVQTTQDYRKKSLADAEKLISGARGELEPATELSANLKSILIDAGIDLKVLTEDGNQFYERAWVTTRDGTKDKDGKGIDQINIMTLVSGFEFQALKKVVDLFTVDNLEAIADELFKVIVHAKLGEKIDKDFQEKIAAKLAGISFKSPALNYLFEALNNNKRVKIGNDEFKLIFEDLLTRLSRLKIIYEEIDGERKYSGGIGEKKREKANGISYTHCYGQGEQEFKQRSFTLVSDIAAINNLATNKYYWFNDAKELP